MPTHHWRAVEPDGQRRQFQCRYFSGRWIFSVRDKQRSPWEPLLDLRRRHWNALREHMFNKYQRHRIPWEHVAELDQLLNQLPEEEDAVAPHPDSQSHEQEAQERKSQKKRRKNSVHAVDNLAEEFSQAAEFPQSTAQQDQEFLWHPFTPMAEWIDPHFQPLVLERAEGCFVWDEDNKRYFDGNATIWTNIHGHANPHILEAISKQFATLDHASFLGSTHPKAVELAKQLLLWANGCGTQKADTPVPSWDAEQASEDPQIEQNAPLARVFFSDNGSTAIEVALRMAIQVRQAIGQPEKTGFIAFENAYHGDTTGAASVSGVSRFFHNLRDFHFPCSRVSSLRQLEKLSPEVIETTTAVIIEPGIQGVNSMQPWPKGMLKKLRRWCDENGLLLILDEVLTGFGRSGSMFAYQNEGIRPDFLCLAKGITGGSMPLAATLTTAEVFESLLDPKDTFYYGHSYTAHPPACAAALANLALFEEPQFFASIGRKMDYLAALFTSLRARCPFVYQTRQYGIIAGIEIRKPDQTPYPKSAQIGTQICNAAKAHGLLTRPILDTIVFLPPLSASAEELQQAIEALLLAIMEILDNNSPSSKSGNPT